ncbi:helicase HerA domain-containing protein, partial [Pseudonocardia nigra]|uniref:helicase HerA domain-containing protein n=1 Tax=Pseudonocardia nigra TaxID=1921578 RepID=UPI001C5E7218
MVSVPLVDAVVGWVAAWWPLLAPGGLLTAAAAVAFSRSAARWRHRRFAHQARLITILPPPRVDPDGAVALWGNLLGLLRPRWQRLALGQPHVGFEYLFSSGGIRIRMWVPGTVPPGLVERAITAAWPGARTDTTPAPSPRCRAHAARPEMVAAGGVLRLARGDTLPIDHDGRGVDPLRGLLAAPGPLGPGEWACVQILARPITGYRLTRATRTRTSTGTPALGRLVGTAHAAVVLVLREVLDIATPGPLHTRTRNTSAATARSTAAPPRVRLVTSAQDRAAAGKTRGGAYATSVRYTATTALKPNTAPPFGQQTGHRDQAVREAAERARAVVRGRAHAIASAFAGFSDHNHYRRHRLRHPVEAISGRRLGRGDVLSVAELAAIAHLPLDEHIPGLSRAGAATIAPPPDIPTTGPGIKTLGDSDHTRGRPVGVAVADARHHLHVIGATGSGKSTLLGRLILDDARAGRGVVVIDPKGDLVTDVHHRIPAPVRASGRLVVFDPDHPGPPPCLNPLAPHPSAEMPLSRVGDVAVENVVSVFRRLFAATWGPRTDDLLRAACLTLRAGPEPPTLAALPRLLTDSQARHRATRHVRDEVLAGFWAWFDTLSDQSRAQVTAPLLNKLRAILLRPFARAALCAGPSTVNLRAVLDHGGILLARLPKGALGDDTTRLIGSLLVAQAWQATTARAHQPPTARRDASLVIDECHNFLNLPYPIEDMLAEARGFAVSLTLAHQHLAQLPRELRDGIATNARNKIFFSVSPDDATHLARHTSPELGGHDLAHLDAFHAAARLVTGGADTPAFTLTTRPLPPLPTPARG